MPQTPARHHADWLSLLEISGPFLSMPVLLAAFPQGVDDFPPEEARSLRADYDYWKEHAAIAGDTAIHRAWVRLVLESMLGYNSQVLLSGQAIPGGLKAEFPEHEETLRPDLMLAEPRTHKARMLIQVYPPNQSLDKAPQDGGVQGSGGQGSRWQASVETRMMELLHTTEIRLGLVTNGEQWMLVDAPRGETTGFTTWEANLWFDEPVTLRAFRSLLGARRFFGVPDEETIESLLAKSAQDQQEITDQLGLQVRHAVEILIQSLDRADQDQGRKLLGADLPPALLYEAALTVMMRLVFMLSAEERKLLPIDDDRYAAYYAVSTLREQLQSQADQNGEEVLERRYDAWSRLLAVFRAVHAGVRHQDLHLPAYGGSLFDPDRYPFLEGRTQANHDDKSAAPLPVNNRTVLHLLDALQMLQVSVPGGAAEKRRLSFRALDVEQIGHVYEGLLDHMATRAAEPVLGLKGTKNQEPEVALAELEKMAGKSEAAFLDWLKEQTGRGVSALKNALALDLSKDTDWASRLRSACGDESLYKRVLPFAGLVRADDLDFPVVILPGSVYVTAGTTRRATGTHYTPRSLTEPIVQHTLEPLVYEGPAEGWPREQWRLRPPAELLALKICDMAMGSAGFLVQVVRYLSERLVEAWALYGTGAKADQAYVERTTFDALAATLTTEDQLIYARRLVAERCVYGVDKNPLAVEIAKLSLWLVTLSKDLPFTFLNHALKCGDSLVGASEDDFLRWANRKKSAAMSLDQEVLREQLETARQLRKELESFVVRDVHDAARKEALLKEAEAAMAHIKRGADLITGVKLLGLKSQEAEDLQVRLVDPFIAGELDGEIDWRKHPDAARALNIAEKERAFYWEFVFPEVFEQGGFNSFVGNPPFKSGSRISTAFGNSYYSYLKNSFPSMHGNTDLCALFVVKSYTLVRIGGTVGLIATNTISQGDTREAGLESILADKATIYWAYSSLPWSGEAAVSVSLFSLAKGYFRGTKTLDDNSADIITAFLDSGSTAKNPLSLFNNRNIGFTGSKPYSLGFLLTQEEAEKLISKNPKNKDVIFPYLNGEDLNSRFDQSASRWIINLFDWPLEKAEQYAEVIEIVRDKVKPDREKVNTPSALREKWWQYERLRPEMYKTIKGLKKVLVCSNVSKWLAFAFVPNNSVLNVNLCVFATEGYELFTVLQSSIHEVWARKYSSSLETRLKYSIADAFETYPLPNFDVLRNSTLSNLGETYHDHRFKVMQSRQEGLTATYNRFHNPDQLTSDITSLRQLHKELDNVVACAYGWEDLDLEHDFHETPLGIRFTISETARQAVLTRLLNLNHERYTEEHAGLGGTTGSGSKGSTKSAVTKGGKKIGENAASGVRPVKPAPTRQGTANTGKAVREAGGSPAPAAPSAAQVQFSLPELDAPPAASLLTRMPFGSLAGTVYRSPMPFGQYDPTGQALREMRQKGVSVVVMLVSDAEAQEKSGRDLRAQYQKEGMQVIAFPISDFQVPDRAALNAVLDQVMALAKEGKNIAVHCHAGIGRTGLFMAELAKKALKMSPSSALYWVRLYIKGAVETKEQERFVLGR